MNGQNFLEVWSDGESNREAYKAHKENLLDIVLLALLVIRLLRIAARL
jgi:hypothetical protein